MGSHNLCFIVLVRIFVDDDVRKCHRRGLLAHSARWRVAFGIGLSSCACER
jgi:hypothetical protein